MPMCVRVCVCVCVCVLTGVKKKLRVTRQLLDASTQKPMSVQEVLELEVKPGWKAGTKLTYEGKGDELPGR